MQCEHVWSIVVARIAEVGIAYREALCNVVVGGSRLGRMDE